MVHGSVGSHEGMAGHVDMMKMYFHGGHTEVGGPHPDGTFGLTSVANSALL